MAFRKFSSALAALVAVGGGLAMPGPAAADTKAGVAAWTAGDYKRAVDEWRLPAQNGDADALFNLAQAYRLGRGVTLDLSQARDLYAAAAAKGHVRAADNYGLLLFGQGEREKAMPLLRAASDRGDPRAQYVLGLAHFNGDFAERDWVRGYALVILAQKAGLPQATPAIQQMDQFISIGQRQEAQVLARSLQSGGSQGDSDAPAIATRPEPKPVLVASAPAPKAAPEPLMAAPAAEASTALSARRSAVTEAKVPEQAAARLPVAKAPVTSPATKEPVPEPKQTLTGDWALQLGAFGVEGNAERLWSKLSGNPALSGTTRYLQRGSKLTVLYANGFESKSAAAQACNSLKAQKQDCIVLKSPD